MSFPIDRHTERILPPDWQGELFQCDVDRTYLATRFSSLGGMLRIPLEWAVDKVEIAGMATLLQEIRRGPEPRSRCTPLYFLSASPAHLRPVVERKMLLDGVEADGTTFKDWGGVLRSRRLARLRDQLGFKLIALLRSRLLLPPGAAETLLGDDLERDPLAFLLYADLIAGRVEPASLGPLLRSHRVAGDDVEEVLDLARQVPVRLAGHPGVRRICIRLERHTMPELLLDCAPHLVACRGAFQMACCLLAQGSIGAAGVVRVAASLRGRQVTPAELGSQFRDGVRRSLLPRALADQLRVLLSAAGLATPEGELPLPDPSWPTAEQAEGRGPWTPRRWLNWR